MRHGLVGALALWMTMSAVVGGAAEPMGWPLISEVPIADGEDALLGRGAARYVALGPYSLTFDVDVQGSNRATRIEMMGEEGQPGIVVEAEEGTIWDFEEVWATPDVAFFVWRGEREGTALLQGATAAPFALAETIPSNPGTHAGGQLGVDPAKIEAGRLYVADGATMPESWRAHFPAGSALARGTMSWREMAWPEHVGRMENARAVVAESLADAGSDEDSRTAAKQLNALLAAEPMPLENDELKGAWQVRSFQGSPGFHVMYPFFKARFVEKADGLFFEKTSGSQRRSGYVRADGARRLIFLGGQTVNEDPQVPYSRMNKGVPGQGAQASDSIGSVEKIGAGHLLMVFDPTDAGGYEIYELKRK